MGMKYGGLMTMDMFMDTWISNYMQYNLSE